MRVRLERLRAQAASLASEYYKDAARYAASIVASQIHVLLLPFYTRQLSVANYGMFELALSAFALMSVALALGVNNLVSIRYFKASDSAEVRVVLPLTYLLHALPVCLFLSLPPVAKYAAQLLFGDEGVAEIVLIIVWVSFFTFFRNVVSDLFIVAGRSGQFLLFESLYTAGLLAFLFAYHAVFTVDVKGILLANLFALLPILFKAAFEVVRRGYVPRLPALLKSVRYGPTLKVSAPLCAAGLSAWVIDLSDRWLLLKLGGGPTEVGYYGLGYKLAALIPMFFDVITRNIVIRRYYFRMSRTQHDPAAFRETIRTYHRFSIGYVGVLICIYAFYYVVLLFAFDIVFTSAYSPALSVVPILSAAMLVRTLLRFYTPPILFAERSVAVLMVSLTAAILNVLLNLVLIPPFGMYGAAVATLLAYAISFAALLHHNRTLTAHMATR